MTHETHPRSTRETATSAREDRDVQNFLDRFARSLTSGDAKAVAALWAVPAYVLGDSMAQCVTTLQEVEQFFGGAKAQYNRRGIVDTRADVFGLEWITDQMCVVDVRWPYIDGRGDEKGQEISTYVLRRDEAGNLMLHVALMRGEQ
jgi:hypothetical protein